MKVKIIAANQEEAQIVMSCDKQGRVIIDPKIIVGSIFEVTGVDLNPEYDKYFASKTGEEVRYKIVGKWDNDQLKEDFLNDFEISAVSCEVVPD